MKVDVFNQYVDKVTGLFNIETKDLFSKTKKREIVDARQLLYYLCYKRPMRLTYIQKYMAENGFILHHTSLLKGIRNVEERLRDDEDYVSIIRELERSVFI